MVRRILIAVVALVVLYFSWQFYTKWRANSLANGEIRSIDSGSSIAEDTPQPAVQPAPAPARAPAPVVQQTVTPSMAVMPSTDSQSPNAANGARFAGSGKYQIYRQGNLTYRIDTETGQQCVLFATDAEWRKPRVLNNGCGSH